jgi:hypothetical protein
MISSSPQQQSAISQSHSTPTTNATPGTISSNNNSTIRFQSLSELLPADTDAYKLDIEPAATAATHATNQTPPTTTTTTHTTIPAPTPTKKSLIRQFFDYSAGVNYLRPFHDVSNLQRWPLAGSGSSNSNGNGNVNLNPELRDRRGVAASPAAEPGFVNMEHSVPNINEISRQPPPILQPQPQHGVTHTTKPSHSNHQSQQRQQQQQQQKPQEHLSPITSTDKTTPTHDKNARPSLSVDIPPIPPFRPSSTPPILLDSVGVPASVNVNVSASTAETKAKFRKYALPKSTPPPPQSQMTIDVGLKNASGKRGGVGDPSRSVALSSSGDGYFEQPHQKQPKQQQKQQHQDQVSSKSLLTPKASATLKKSPGAMASPQPRLEMVSEEREDDSSTFSGPTSTFGNNVTKAHVVITPPKVKIPHGILPGQQQTKNYPEPSTPSPTRQLPSPVTPGSAALGSGGAGSHNLGGQQQQQQHHVVDETEDTMAQKLLSKHKLNPRFLEKYHLTCEVSIGLHDLSEFFFFQKETVVH